MPCRSTATGLLRQTLSEVETMRRRANDGRSQATRRTALGAAGVLGSGLLPHPSEAGAANETLALWPAELTLNQA